MSIRRRSSILQTNELLSGQNSIENSKKTSLSDAGRAQYSKASEEINVAGFQEQILAKINASQTIGTFSTEDDPASVLMEDKFQQLNFYYGIGMQVQYVHTIQYILFYVTLIFYFQ